MAKKKGSKNSRSKSQRRVLDAFQLAEKAEGRERHNEYSSDSDNEEIGVTKNGILNARKLLGRSQGNADEDEDEDEEFEDEELDSDEALGSDDDFDILNSKFSQTIRDKAKLKKRGEYDGSDEDEGGYTSIDEDELMPLSAVWDLDDQNNSKESQTQDIVLNDDLESSDESESGSESETEVSEDESGEESDVFEGFDDDEEIDLKSVKSSLVVDQVKKREKKRLNNLQLEENEFNLPTNGQKLSLADMMAGVDASVKKNTVLIEEDLDENDKNKALAVPLPKRIQDRHERKAAYELQIEEVNKWEDTVKENRRAEVLKFPLNAGEELAPHVTSFDPTTKPMTELEHKVNDMLELSSLLDTKKEAQFEDIAVLKMSKEELHLRQNELRLMRELMFREEKKAKRVKKIKSKTYHKIKKKELRRNRELVEGENESDQEEHDIKRAKERMTLKHKNQSDWAKTMIKSGMSRDVENRSEMEEMLRLGEKLRSRIMLRDGDDHSDDGGVDLSDLEHEGALSDEDNLRSKLGKGVMAMDFMKNAEKRAKMENAKNIEQLRALEENRLHDFEENVNSIDVEKNEGRRVYAPSVNRQKSELNQLNKATLQEVEDDEAKSLVNRLSLKSTLVASKPAETHKDAKDTDEAAENPWLADSGATKAKHSSKISGVVDKNSSKFEKTQHQMNKKKRSASKVDLDDAMIDMDQTLNVVDAYGGSDEEQDQGSDGLEIHMFKQKDLIKEAFAGDDVVAEFEAEKKQVAKDEGDREVDLTLPGWGDWAGGNKKSSKRKKIVRKINGVVEADKRKDKKLKSVIINEKVNKKNLKYQSNGVPYPFETMEQYERSLRMPIGQEWTSREVHQKMTMPRVIAKHGSVIDPLKAPFK